MLPSGCGRFLGLEPLEHVTVLVGVVPAAESIAPDESESMGFATVFWVLGLCTASVFLLHCLLPLRLRPCSCWEGSFPFWYSRVFISGLEEDLGTEVVFWFHVEFTFT